MSVALFDGAVSTMDIVLGFEVLDKANSELTFVIGEVREELNFIEVSSHHGDLLFE